MNAHLVLLGILCAMGAGWGLTQPLAKIAVSGNFAPLGLVFWQLSVGAIFLFAVLGLAGKLRWPNRQQWRVALIITFIGTILPGIGSYRAAMHLPAGIIAILISMVPILAFPMALALRLDHFSWRRCAGLVAGFCGVLFLVAPKTSLSDATMIAFIPLALIAPLFYAFEGNYVARWGLEGLTPIETLFWANILGMLITLPATLIMDKFALPSTVFAPEFLAILGIGVIHSAVYSCYVWMVGRAGPVFTAQVSYAVTLFGITWSIWLLDESYSAYVWAALFCILGGMALVRPRNEKADEPVWLKET